MRFNYSSVSFTKKLKRLVETIMSLINDVRIRLVNLFCLVKHKIQKLLIFKGVFLSVILVSVSVIEASHAEEDDCDELSCLICHANADTEQTKLSQSFEIFFTPAEPNFLSLKLPLDRVSEIRIPIRAPPQQNEGVQR